jgi:hypothetical protein
MKYIIQALRNTYYTERKAHPGLNDLINMAEDDYINNDFDECFGALEDIDTLLHDINLPIQEDV